MAPPKKVQKMENVIVIENEKEESDDSYEIPTITPKKAQKIKNPIVIENEPDSDSAPPPKAIKMENGIVIENEKENEVDDSYEIPAILIGKEDRVKNQVASSVSLDTPIDTPTDDNESIQHGTSDSGFSGSISEAPTNISTPLMSTENVTAGSTKTVNSSSSPLDPKLSPGLAKSIHEKTLKFPEDRPEPPFCHCVIDGCGYRSFGEIAQKYHAKEVHNLPKPQFVEKLLNDI